MGAVRESFTPRRVVLAIAGLVALLVGGTIAFHQALNETWLQSFYRTIVTVSLTGLDTVPRNDESRAISIVLVLAGLTIFAYVAAILVEGIAGGVFTGALAERRRRRTIEQLSGHYIICGYGRVGRRVAAEFRESGTDYVVLDFSKDAIDEARGGGRPLRRGHGHRGRGPPGGRARAGARARRVVRLGRGQPLHRALGAGGAARPADRRAGLRRGRGQEAAARRRRPRRSAVLDGRQGDGEARPAAAGGRVPRHRLDERRPGAALRGDRGQGDVRSRGQVDPRAQGARR